MSAIDFARSYMTSFGENEGSMSRIQLEAACTIIDEASGAEDIYYLTAPRTPTPTTSSSSCPTTTSGVSSARKSTLSSRTHWVTEPDYLDDPGLDTTGGRASAQPGKNRDRWGEVRLDIETFADSTVLETNKQVVDGTLANRSLVDRTGIRDAASGTRALLEYPIKTMNVLRKPMRYQVDAGPLIVSDFGSTEAMQVERFDIAHVVYNRPKEIIEGADAFIRSRTTPRGKTTKATTNCSPPADRSQWLRTATGRAVRRGAGGRRRIRRPRRRPGLRPPARH